MITISREELRHENLNNRIEQLIKRKNLVKKIEVLYPNFRDYMQLQIERSNLEKDQSKDARFNHKLLLVKELNEKLNAQIAGLKLQEVMDLKNEDFQTLLEDIKTKINDIFKKFADLMNILFASTKDERELMKHFKVLRNKISGAYDFENEEIVIYEKRLFEWMKDRFSKLKKSNKIESIHREKQYCRML